MDDDEYELLPHKRLVELEQEVERLSKHPLGSTAQGKELLKAVESLDKSINRLISVFKVGAKQAMPEHDDTAKHANGQLEKKIDGMVSQNQQLAEAMVKLADQLKDMKAELEQVKRARPPETRESPELPEPFAQPQPVATPYPPPTTGIAHPGFVRAPVSAFGAPSPEQYPMQYHRQFAQPARPAQPPPLAGTDSPFPDFTQDFGTLNSESDSLMPPPPPPKDAEAPPKKKGVFGFLKK